LRTNCELYGPRLHPFNLGASDRCHSAPLTFYETSTVFSSFHPDLEQDRRAIETVVANMVKVEVGGSTEPVGEYVNELMTGRLNSRTFECKLVSVGDIVRENGLRRIDLLKVDAEKCELEILRGIEESIWPLISQIVVEVHDQDGD